MYYLHGWPLRNYSDWISPTACRIVCVCVGEEGVMKNAYFWFFQKPAYIIHRWPLRFTYPVLNHLNDLHVSQGEYENQSFDFAHHLEQQE